MQITIVLYEFRNISLFMKVKILKNNALIMISLILFVMCSLKFWAQLFKANDIVS